MAESVEDDKLSFDQMELDDRILKVTNWKWLWSDEHRMLSLCLHL